MWLGISSSDDRDAWLFFLKMKRAAMSSDSIMKWKKIRFKGIKRNTNVFNSCVTVIDQLLPERSPLRVYSRDSLWHKDLMAKERECKLKTFKSVELNTYNRAESFIWILKGSE